jgi:hypothetical protein
VALGPEGHGGVAGWRGIPGACACARARARACVGGCRARRDDLTPAAGRLDAQPAPAAAGPRPQGPARGRNHREPFAPAAAGNRVHVTRVGPLRHARGHTRRRRSRRPNPRGVALRAATMQPPGAWAKTTPISSLRGWRPAAGWLDRAHALSSTQPGPPRGDDTWRLAPSSAAWVQQGVDRTRSHALCTQSLHRPASTLSPGCDTGHRLEFLQPQQAQSTWWKALVYFDRKGPLSGPLCRSLAVADFSPAEVRRSGGCNEAVPLFGRGCGGLGPSPTTGPTRGRPHVPAGNGALGGLARRRNALFSPVACARRLLRLRVARPGPPPPNAALAGLGVAPPNAAPLPPSPQPQRPRQPWRSATSGSTPSG